MVIYWFLFGYFAVGAIIAGSLPAIGRKPNVLFTLGAVLVCIVVGLRNQVGGDWLTYDLIYRTAGGLKFGDALGIGDPGYQAVNWLAYQIGGGVWLVNLVCAAIFVWGLFRFCRLQPAPWLAALAAIPYMVIVVAMGYTRQAVALGILMAGLAAYLRGGSPLRFVVYVAIASEFHRTAVIGLPLMMFTSEQNRFMNLLVVLAGGIALYDAFLGDSMDHFVQNYIAVHYSSQGAAIRVAMTLLAALLFWLLGRRLHFEEREWKLWRNYSYAAVACFLMLLISPSSTAVDRLSLYLLPLQLVILGRVPLIFKSRIFGHALVAAYLFAVEFVWLNFGQFSSAWVPYHSFLPI